MMILVIMSHGTNGRILTSEGKSFDVEQIYQMFNNSCCSKLKGKPKFFIIQVSRWLYWHDWSSEAFWYFSKLMICLNQIILFLTKQMCSCSEQYESKPDTFQYFTVMLHVIPMLHKNSNWCPSLALEQAVLQSKDACLLNAPFHQT